MGCFPLVISCACVLGLAAGTVRAESVKFAMAGEKSNTGPNVAGDLMMEISRGEPSRPATIRVTLYDHVPGTSPINSVFLTGGPIVDANLVSCSGTGALWGRRFTDDDPATNDRSAPRVYSTTPGGPSNTQILTWECLLGVNTTMDDVVAGITGTKAHPAWLHLGLRVSTPAILGHGPDDEYHAFLVVTVPVPRQALTGAGMLAGLAGLGYVRRRGHLRE